MLASIVAIAHIAMAANPFPARANPGDGTAPVTESRVIAWSVDSRAVPPALERASARIEAVPVGLFTHVVTPNGARSRDAIPSIVRLRFDGGIRVESADEAPATETPAGEDSTATEDEAPVNLARQVGLPETAAPKKSRPWLVWAGSAALAGLFVAGVVRDLSNEEGNPAEGSELPYFPATP
jgi:hypothetical protein